MLADYGSLAAADVEQDADGQGLVAVDGEVADLLSAALFEQLKVFLFQTWDNVAACIADRDEHVDDANRRTELRKGAGWSGEQEFPPSHD
ncbi:MAG: hypothetical protein WDO18_15330 [Acidobacteriota bacterium]